jgi:hypothetical protein
MQAFLSYSIAESDQYVLTLLAKKLRERGFSVVSNYKEVIDSLSKLQIGDSTLFIGIIAKKGKDLERVNQEIQFAIRKNKPMILLVEDNIKVADWVENFPNTIKFNRFYPNLAIEEVNQRIQLSQQQPQQDNTLPWILGGVAALALISLLSSEKK